MKPQGLGLESVYILLESMVVGVIAEIEEERRKMEKLNWLVIFPPFEC